MSQAKPTNLCQYCRKIPFDSFNPPFGDSLEALKSSLKFATEVIFHLGTLGRILQSECSLCKLVSYATLVAQQTENEHLDEVNSLSSLSLQWRDKNIEATPGPHFALFYDSRSFSKGTLLAFTQNIPPIITSSIDGPNCFWFRPLANNTMTIDFKKVRGWIRHCDNQHEKCGWKLGRNGTNEPYQVSWPFPDIEVMRFIDVKKYCIVETPAVCRYIALAMFGEQYLRFGFYNPTGPVSSSLVRYETDGASFPPTIQDAITLTHELGERYLWIDSLCLVQNDASDLEAGTNVMDLVYESSVLTIVAACGRDSGHGLPGVRTGSRHVPLHVSEVLPGLQLSVYTAPKYLMKPTIYSSRAWTLQEEKLSTRILYFVQDQIYLQCQSRIQPENCVDHIELLLIPGWIQMLRDAPGASLSEHMRDYAATVENYTSRSLTYQSDAYNALRGVIRRSQSDMGSRFFCGLPSAYFEAFVSFRAAKASLRRRKDFPSYSWSGWMGPIRFPTAMLDRTKLASGGYRFDGHHWIEWYRTDSKLQIYPATRTQPPNKFPIIPGLSLPTNLPQTPRAIGRPGSDDSSPKTSVPRYTMMVFWTLSVFLGLGSVDLRSRGALMDKSNRVCGHLFLDGHDDTHFFVENGVEGKPPLELILLSFGWGWKAFNHYSLTAVPVAAEYHHEDTFIVICIERLSAKGPDGKSIHYVERRGIGQMAGSAVLNSFLPGPKWKQITLA